MGSAVQEASLTQKPLSLRECENGTRAAFARRLNSVSHQSKSTGRARGRARTCQSWALRWLRALGRSGASNRPMQAVSVLAVRPRPPQIRVADFFCGCGGTSAGLRAAGMQIALGVDIDRDAAETFRLNFPEARFMERDVRALNPDEVAQQLGPADGTLLLIAACAPCQPYSSLHRSCGTDGRRTLLLSLIPFLERLRPELLLVENVPGLETGGTNSAWEPFLEALGDLGYAVDWRVVDARDFGVPQRRRRLVLLGSRLGAVAVPAPTHGPAGERRSWSTVWDWIGHLPPLAAGEHHPDVSNHQASALTHRNLERLRATPPGGTRLSWPKELWLDCHDGHRGHSDVYGRMRADGQAPALTTKCTSISNGRFGHPFQDRPISVREAACLQTFPAGFVFSGGIRSATRQVGNAVPVLLAQRIGEAILHTLKRRGVGSRAGGAKAGPDPTVTRAADRRVQREQAERQPSRLGCPTSMQQASRAPPGPGMRMSSSRFGRSARIRERPDLGRCLELRCGRCSMAMRVRMSPKSNRLRLNASRVGRWQRRAGTPSGMSAAGLATPSTG